MNWKEYIESPECWDEVSSLAENEVSTVAFAVEEAVSDAVESALRRVLEAHPELNDSEAIQLLKLRCFIQRRVCWYVSEWMEENYTKSDWS